MVDQHPGPPKRSPHAQQTVSCLECRRKKQGCDRQKPCGRCIRLKRELDCTYAPDPRNARNSPWRPQTNGSTRPLGMALGPTENDVPIQVARSRALAKASSSRIEPGRSPPPTGDREGEAGGSQACSAGVNLRFHAKYRGKRFVDEFPAVESLMRDMQSSFHESLNELSRDLRTMQNMLTKWSLPLSSSEPLDRGILHARLRRILPPKEECDTCIAIYFETYGGMVRAFRRCDIARHYHAFWQLDNTGNSDQFRLVLTMIVILARLARSKHKVALATIPQELESATRNVQLVRAWLDIRRFRESLEIQTLQVQILLWTFDAVLGAKPQKLWELSGSIYRNAIAQDLPRVASSACEQEESVEKRILWAAVLEIELQSSISVGLKSVMSLEVSENLLPLGESMDTDPLSIDNHFTTGTTSQTMNHLPQAYLSQSMSLRYKAHTMINEKSWTNYQSALDLAMDLERMIRSRPEELTLDQTNSSPVGNKVPFADRVAVDYLLRRSIISLLTPFVLSFSSNHSMYTEGFLIWMRSVLEIQSYSAYSKLPMNAAGASRSIDWSFCLPFLRLDLVQAALGVLLAYKGLTISPEIPAGQASRLNLLSYWTRDYFLGLVEGTIEYLVEPRPWARRDLKGPISLLIALESCKKHDDDEQRNHAIRQRIMRLIEHVLEREKTMMGQVHD